MTAVSFRSRNMFTGKERDSESGLDYFGARYYGGALGRWASPDPSGLDFADLGNPQSLNLYAYVLNNPLSSVDPHGLDDEPCGGGGNVVASGVDEGPSPCGGGVDPNPKPMPPDIDPCAGSPDSCYSAAAAQEVENDAAMLTFASMKDPSCRSALTTARQSSSSLTRAFGNWPTLQAAGSANGIDPSFLAGTGVRESGFQNIRQYGGGMGRGYFQIDLESHPGVSEGQAFDINFSANFAARLLSSNRRLIAQHHPNLNAERRMQAAAASYNGSTISGNPNTIDVGTTGENYGSNVLSLRNSCFAF